VAEPSDLRRRVTALEQRTSRITELLRLLFEKWPFKRQRNVKSSSLTPGEIAAFRQRMEAHGIPDDEDSDVKPAASNRTKSGMTTWHLIAASIGYWVLICGIGLAVLAGITLAMMWLAEHAPILTLTGIVLAVGVWLIVRKPG
jgi:hypothetical protein